MTPWGMSDSSTKICTGFTSYTTAGHGGVCVSMGLSKHLSKYTVKQAEKFGSGLWFEEDCAWALPAYDLCKNLPGFEEKLLAVWKSTTIEYLEKTIKRWYGDYPFDKTDEKHIPMPSINKLMVNDILTINASNFKGKGIIEEIDKSVATVQVNGMSMLLKSGVYTKVVTKIERDGEVLWQKED
jgi:hypothetical protein